MRDESKVIFREKALRLYLQNQQKVTLLRLVRPRLFAYFWGLLAGLTLLAGLAWTAQVPVTINGVGLITRLGSSPSQQSRIVVLSLLPPDRLDELRSQQRVLVRGHEFETQFVARIVHIEPGVLSPDEVRHRFALTGALAEAVDGPAAVAVAGIEAETGGLRADAFSGSRSRIDVEIGSQRVLGLIPGLSSWFQGQDHR